MKDVQAKYPDEFAELKDIHERYKRLLTSNQGLRDKDSEIERQI